MNGDQTERLPQEGECRNEGEGGILEIASNFAHRVLKEIEALAGTTACKSVQLVRLKKWAQEQGCWFENCSQFGDFFDRGSENEVYLIYFNHEKRIFCIICSRSAPVRHECLLNR